MTGRGMAAKNRTIIDAAKTILERIHPATVRGRHAMKAI
jgi:hypothetical protein